MKKKRKSYSRKRTTRKTHRMCGKSKRLYKKTSINRKPKRITRKKRGGLKNKEEEKKIVNAIETGNISVLQDLITRGNLDVDTILHHKDYVHGDPILHIAVVHQRLDLIKLLLEKGADPNIKDLKRGESPLHIAAQMNNVEIVETLLTAVNPSLPLINVNIHTTDSPSDTPLARAFADGGREGFSTQVFLNKRNKIIDLLRDHGADNPKLYKLNSRFPIHVGRWGEHTFDSDVALLMSNMRGKYGLGHDSTPEERMFSSYFKDYTTNYVTKAGMKTGYDGSEYDIGNSQEPQALYNYLENRIQEYFETGRSTMGREMVPTGF